MGEKAKGRLPNKLPKINLKIPNRFYSYLKERHQSFVFGMIVKEGFKNQSEVTNEAFRLMEERYIHVHGETKFKKLMEYGRQAVANAKKKQNMDDMANFDDEE